MTCEEHRKGGGAWRIAAFVGLLLAGTALALCVYTAFAWNVNPFLLDIADSDTVQPKLRTVCFASACSAVVFSILLFIVLDKRMRLVLWPVATGIFVFVAFKAMSATLELARDLGIQGLLHLP